MLHVFRNNPFHDFRAQYRATLTGGAHRLRAVLMCAADFQLLLDGKDTKMDWNSSPFSSDNPPEWFTGIPSSLHYLGPDESAYLDRSMSMGQALNDLNGASNAGTYGDLIFYIDATRHGSYIG